MTEAQAHAIAEALSEAQSDYVTVFAQVGLHFWK